MDVAPGYQLTPLPSHLTPSHLRFIDKLVLSSADNLREKIIQTFKHGMHKINFLIVIYCFYCLLLNFFLLFIVHIDPGEIERRSEKLRASGVSDTE